MKKRSIKKILTIVLLLVVFINYKPVYAEGDTLSLKINNVMQDNKTLQLVDGKYVVTGYGEVVVDYELINYDSQKEYYVFAATNDLSGGSPFNNQNINNY